MRVKTAVMHTLAQLAHVLHSKLGPHFQKMLPEFEKIMSDPQAYELILDTLIIMKRLFKGSDDNHHFYQ